MNGLPPPQQSHTKYIVGAITLIGFSCGMAGAWLGYKGYNGELLIGIAASAVSGLVGFLSGRSPAPTPDAPTGKEPPTPVKITNLPVPVTEQPKL